MLKIISADDRMKQKRHVNICMFAPTGWGKTYQATTLDPKTTLFIDLEAGTLALKDWGGDVINVRQMANDMGVHPWEFIKALACYIGGPDPMDADGAYSKAAYAQIVAAFGDPAKMDKYDMLYFDSITVASRMAFSWSQKQPEAFSEKTGKPDTRGAYGLLGRELVRWFTVCQHIQKSKIMVAILDKEVDDLKRVSWVPQIDGTKAALALPGIFDEVVTGANLTTDEGQQYRAFVCHQTNQFGFPAKDRSGRLDMIEPADLAALIRKMTSTGETA